MATVVFVLPFGEPEEAYFADTLLTLLAADAHRAGHQVHVVRVYYHGRDAGKDAQIRRRLAEYLSERDPDLVVLERLFDPEPVTEGGRAVLQVTRGDPVEPETGVAYVLGAVTDPVPGRPARRAPSVGGLRAAFREVIAALESGVDLGQIAGVARVEEGQVQIAAPLAAESIQGPFDPLTTADVIAPGEPPQTRHKTLIGNVGCPFAADPLQTPHFAGVELPGSLPIARLGCAFCHMGGDYEKRPDAEVVASLLEQAEYFFRALPDVRCFTIDDQHSIRYLPRLVREAAARGLAPMRWLFPARPDSFSRESASVEEAARIAAEVGHVIEVHLSGFEAFCDRELARYNKGCTKAELLGAVARMRELQAEYPASFEYAAARAHSLLLWNPWTSLADVRESVAAIRAHDLRELFHEIGRNRLRLYRELPIHWAALRDGAVVDRWPGEDSGTARRKGYSTDVPWRFLDPRTHIAHQTAAKLRDRLGRESELDQLEAALDFAEGDHASWEPGLAELEAELAHLLAPTREVDQPERALQTRAAPCLLDQRTRPRDLDAALTEAARNQVGVFAVGGDVLSHPMFAELRDPRTRARRSDRAAAADRARGPRTRSGESQCARRLPRNAARCRPVRAWRRPRGPRAAGRGPSRRAAALGRVGGGPPSSPAPTGNQPANPRPRAPRSRRSGDPRAQRCMPSAGREARGRAVGRGIVRLPLRARPTAPPFPLTRAPPDTTRGRCTVAGSIGRRSGAPRRGTSARWAGSSCSTIWSTSRR